MSIGSCWLFGWILLIVITACMSPDLNSILGSKFGQPMAQIYYDALGKSGAIGMMVSSNEYEPSCELRLVIMVAMFSDIS